MSKTPKTVHFDDEQIRQIKEMEKTNPIMKDRGFSWVVRWLLDKALGIKRDEEGEDEQE